MWFSHHFHLTNKKRILFKEETKRKRIYSCRLTSQNIIDKKQIYQQLIGFFLSLSSSETEDHEFSTSEEP